MSYFDLHMHPVFKRFICDFEAIYPTERAVEEVVMPIHLKNIGTRKIDEYIFHILGSQCCFEQLEKGQVEFGIIAIAPVEQFFAQREGLFGKVLNSRFFTNPLDQNYMIYIRENKISYYQLFIKEFSLYRKLQHAGVITFLKRYDHNSVNGSGMKMALALEGGHGLCRTRIGISEEDEIIGWDDTKSDALMQDFKDFPVLSAAESLKHLQQSLWNSEGDLFYLTLTHLSYIKEQFLCSHAYGMKMLKGSLGFPNGNGLHVKGKDVIDVAYNLEVTGPDNAIAKAPVLIDIKHMSLKSRIDFYAYRNEKSYTLPILATHMGVTGYSINEWKGALGDDYFTVSKDHVSISIEEKYAGEWGGSRIANNSFTFNPWSINLMDEDITEIINSNGLIGISLDIRILGWDRATKRNKESDEIISREDFRDFFPEKYSTLIFDEKIIDEKIEESYLNPTKEERQPLALCFNIIHILSVGMLTIKDKDIWKHICIGSDLDGLVDPVVNCSTAGNFPELERKLMQWLPIAESTYLENNGGFAVLPKDRNQLAEKVRDFCFNNGKKFIEKWVRNEIV